MILLFGGTGETEGLATGLADAGYRVLVSTATDVPLKVGDHERIGRRCGRLDDRQIAEFVRREGIRAIVDSTHPYASQVQEAARAAASLENLPYLRYRRRAALEAESGLVFADDHEEAAWQAFAFGLPVLLTTGSRNLAPYLRQAVALRVQIFARVLPHEESIEACDRAGLPASSRIFGRGPFSVDENRALIRRHGIGVLVTKDSGQSGGVLEKMEAARLEGCRVVVIRRPEGSGEEHFSDFPSLIRSLQGVCPPGRKNIISNPVSPPSRPRLTDCSRGDSW